MKKGDKVKILSGPRKGQIGIVNIVAINGVFVKMSDGLSHTVTDKNVEIINE